MEGGGERQICRSPGITKGVPMGLYKKFFLLFVLSLLNPRIALVIVEYNMSKVRSTLLIDLSLLMILFSDVFQFYLYYQMIMVFLQKREELIMREVEKVTQCVWEF